MDDKNQKERLEQELRFLKESFEAEVISKEEYEKGSDRIEKKLNEIENGKSGNEETADAKKEDPIESEQEEKAVEIPDQEAQKIGQEEEIPKGQKNNKLFRYAIVFVVLALVIFFSYSLLKAKPAAEKAGAGFVAVCNSDADCRQEGKEGKCLYPGAKESKCEFKEIQKTGVLVLNDRKNCFNCGTQRVLGILESWFGELEAKEIDYNTNEGKALAESADIRLLPAYILDENITNKHAFEQFKRAFVKKNGTYVLSEDAAGSTFYFNRENIPNKLDLFVKPDASAKAESNLQEFLDNFKDVRFEKHLSDSGLAQELGIKNFPTFLVNNKVKFSGVQTANAIKDNFCSFNKADACSKTLSKSLV